MRPHAMIVEADTADEVLFACPDCARRVVVGKQRPRLTVIDQGDFFATHVGGSPTAAVSVVP